jgi:hypothetical protein
MTNTTRSYALAHLTTVDNSEPDGSGDHFASCSCGWTGGPHDEAVWAQIDAQGHVDQAAGPPDAVDRTITDLLDLQDDLAVTVVWLAEHWSADLPAPDPVATTHGTGADAKVGVRLLVYCGTPGEFAQAADVVAAPVTVDPAPNRYGGHYRRAVRRIGRVHIDAYTLVEDGEAVR